MKKILALSLVLAAATIAKGAVPSSIEVRRGGLVATNAGGAGLYLTSDGTNYYWALVTSSNTNIPPYVLTNNQASAATFSSDVNIATLLQVTGTGGGTGVRVAGRTDLSSANVTNFLRNYGWFQVDGAQTNLTSIFLQSGSPIYFLNVAGNIAGQLSANNLQTTNVTTTNIYVNTARITGSQTNTGYIRFEDSGSEPLYLFGGLFSPGIYGATEVNIGAVGEGMKVDNTGPGRLLFAQQPYGNIGSSTAYGIDNIYASNVVAGAVHPTGLGASKLLRTSATTNLAEVTVGSGLAFDGTTLSATGGGGGGGAPAMSYVALPASGIVGGAQLAYSTNLTADISVTFSNLLGTNRYFLQWLSTGQKVTFNNSGSLFFLDAGQGGYSESSTNSGVYELQVWKDDVSGRTNVLFNGREYSIAAGTGTSFSTNNLTGIVTISASGLPTSLPTPSFGALLSQTPSGTQWSFGTPNGRWVVDEEFWTMANDTTLNHGSELWSQSRANTYVLTNNGAIGFGVWAVSLRTAGSRYGITLGNSGTYASTRFTNCSVLFLTRVMTSSVDGGGDTNTARIGFIDALSAEPSNGIYFRSTNNVWELVTARNGVRTVTANSAAALLANQWQDLAWYIDSTGTNVFGYIGTSATNMTCIATNSLTIPHDSFSTPGIYFQRGLTNGTAVMTNFVDYYKVWVRQD